MKLSDIDKIELVYLQMSDYMEIKDVMKSAYSSMPDQYWRENQIATLLEKFPEGQVVIKVNDRVAGCALSIIVNYDKFDDNHS